jgi:hypothetical protein
MGNEKSEPPREVSCDCNMAGLNGGTGGSELSLHVEDQDTAALGWQVLLDLIDRAAKDGATEFNPGRGLSEEVWRQIVTLPPSIATLKSVKKLNLHGSNIARIPAEIGEMAALETLNMYTSYRLHWLPYEITRCRNLKRSTFSTRALYGNYKYRPPFPRLPNAAAERWSNGECSVCRGALGERVVQRWISLRVATDTLPLLVNACSERCIQALPVPGPGVRGVEYVPGPHSGGLELEQPPAD